MGVCCLRAGFRLGLGVGIGVGRLAVTRGCGFGVDLGRGAFDALQRLRDGRLGRHLYPFLDIGIPLVSVVRDKTCQRDVLEG